MSHLGTPVCEFYTTDICLKNVCDDFTEHVILFVLRVFTFIWLSSFFLAMVLDTLCQVVLKMNRSLTV